MKKYFFKRIVAIFIDVLVVVFVYSIIFGTRLVLKQSRLLGIILVLFPICLRDVLLWKRSLGKRFLGLLIVDQKWKTPSVVDLIKRGTFSCTLGYYKFLFALFVTGDYIGYLDWEREKLHAIVIEKKLYGRLREEASKGGEFDPAKMSMLYSEHLLSK